MYPEQRTGSYYRSWLTRGRRHSAGAAYVMVDQMYVQEHTREDDRGRAPILFLHGGGLTGTMWEFTADGRPGWALRSIEAGWPVVVVDAVDSGRSGIAPEDARSGTLEWKNALDIWVRYRIGDRAGWEQRVPFPGQQFPVGSLDALLAAHTTRRRAEPDGEAAALEEVLDRIGPCHVIAHSRGAAMLARAWPQVADRLLNVVLLEPVPYEAATDLPSDRVLIVWGDHIDIADEPGWLQARDAWTAGSATHLDLPAVGIRGSSHVMMSDRNSDAVLEHVLRWLTRGSSMTGAR